MSILLPLCGGLLFGATLESAGFSCKGRARGLTSRGGLRTLLMTLGLGMVLTALLCWLAVIDVDRLVISPLTSGVLIGALIFGAAVGLIGGLPCTFFSGLGGGEVLLCLCGVLGCAAGAMLGTLLPDGLADGLFAPMPGTLFRLTLVDPWLLGGEFGALACLGALVCVAALFVRRKRCAEMSDKIDDVPAEPQDDRLAELASEPPIMTDHPDDEPPPEAPEASLLEAMSDMQSHAGQVQPAVDADLPPTERAVSVPDDEAADDGDESHE